MKAYVINLDRSPERLALFLDRAAKEGLEVERVPAVDGRTLDDADLARMVSPDFRFQPVSASEAAVFLSHRAAWERLLASGDEMAAIFEDDAVLAADMAALLASIEQLGQAFGICRLETTGRMVVVGRQAVKLAAGHAMHRQLTWHGGAAGYVITRNAARLLVERFGPLADPVDQVLFHPFSEVFDQLDVRQVIPGAVIQHEFLFGTQGKPELASTIARRKKRGRIFRHSFLTDLKLAWMRHLERRARNRLARDGANLKIRIPFSDWAGRS